MTQAPTPVTAADPALAAAILAALGGARNVSGVEAAVQPPAGRRWPTRRRRRRAALRALGVRGVARTGAASVQLILAEDAAALGTALVSVP